MGAGHDHGLDNLQHERPLWWALGLTAAFVVVEVVGALKTNSLALLSDAAHMGTDVIALAIALAAVRMSRRPADAKRTYGYVRMEALGAMVNGGLLFLLAAYILWEAFGRFRTPPEVATGGMLVIASIGLVVNLISMRLLKAGSGESLNMKGAYIEVWSDMLGSVAVIVGALLIRFTGWAWIDPVLAVLIGLWVLPRTWTLLREAVHLLLEGVPRGLVVDDVRTALLAHPGVAGVHDLHVWSLSSTQPLLSAHVVATDGQDTDTLCRALATLLHDRFDITHATLQMERAPCDEPGCEASTNLPPHAHD